MSEIKLKPCPFCGGEARKNKNRECWGHGEYATKISICCTSCGANVCVTDRGKSEISMLKEAIYKWNKRKPMDMIIERLEALKNNVSNADFINGVVASLIEVTRENEE